MGMRERLETLDQAVLEQFERVTEAAEKTVGWDKWDLTRMANTAWTVLLIGYGTYKVMLGINGDSSESVIGSFAILGGCASYSLNPQHVRESKQEEEKLILATGASPKPQYTMLRPARLSLSLLLFSAATHDLFVGRDNVPSSLSSLSIDEYSRLKGLSLLALGGANLFYTFSSYFQSQSPRPPSTKKSFWKTLYQRVSTALSAKPQPEKAPVPTIDYSTPTEVST